MFWFVEGRNKKSAQRARPAFTVFEDENNFFRYKPDKAPEGRV